MSSKDVACHMTSYDWELFYCVHEVGPVIISRQTFLNTTFHVMLCVCVFPLFLTSISSSSSVTPLGGRTLRKPRWTWTCSYAGLTRSSSGWSQRCVCALSSASACSSSRSSSKLPPSKQTSSHRCVLSSPLLCLSEFLFCCSCKEYRNLNGFFAVTMGLSNPAVSRLNLTWEVRRGLSPPSHSSLSSVQLLLFCPQKLPSKFRKFYREFENLMASWSSSFCTSEHLCLVFWPGISLLRGGPALLTVSVTVSTGPVQEPPSVPADRSQTGSSHYSFHASAD